MNYQKAWEMLKSAGNNEILKQMEEIEIALNATKKETKKVEFNYYEYEKEELIKELNKYSIEEIKQIARKNAFTWNYGKKDKEYIVNNLAIRMDRRNRKGDCFR